MSVHRKLFFAERQRQKDGNTHRHPNSNSSLDTVQSCHWQHEVVAHSYDTNAKNTKMQKKNDTNEFFYRIAKIPETEILSYL